MCLALAFLPPELIPRAFNLIVCNSPPKLERNNNNNNICKNKLVIGFLFYVAENYVGLTLNQLDQGVKAFAKPPQIKTSYFEDEEQESELEFDSNNIITPDDHEICDPPLFPTTLWNLRNRVESELIA